MPDPTAAPRFILGIGASSAGAKALEDFLTALPPRTGWACVIVPPADEALPPCIENAVSRRVGLPVRPATDGLPLCADAVYVLPAGKLVTVRGGFLEVQNNGVAHTEGDGPLDRFLRSLAKDAGPRSAAIILAGDGRDGVEGARSIASAGGIVLAQDPATAACAEQPHAAIQSGCVRAVLPPSAMPDALLAAQREPARGSGRGEPGPTSETVQANHGPVLELLRAHHGLDFAVYRPGTVDRRIRRRMALAECLDSAAYAARLRADPTELDNLRHDLLIGVTEFFREPESFAWLGSRILPELFRSHGREEFRAWCAGCATGEEAYSVAILLDEVARAVGFTGRVSVFATDVHPQALETASAGRYEESKLQPLGAERIERYFQPPRDGLRRVSADLRVQIVFAPHDLLVDPPFTRIDLAVCRNLLIYLEPEAQERVVNRFHHALRPGGVLFLGASESVGKLVEHFDLLDARHKIYRKNSDHRLPFASHRLPGQASAASLGNGTLAAAGALPSSVGRHILRAYDHLLHRHAPPGFLVDSSGLLLHCFGDAGRLLLSPEGRIENNLLSRTTGDLRLALSTLLTRALRAPGPVEAHGVRIGDPGASGELVDLVAEAVPDPAAGPSLIHIAVPRTRQAPPLDPLLAHESGFAPDAARHDRLAHLEAELQSTKENLQATVEQLQTANEELQSTNEELLAANEELQAANEELHSLNEELHSVNAEFERKNSELQQLNADLDNLLGALEVGTVFLDRELRIRKFNPAIERCFRLLPQDIGRPISHIAYQLDDQAHLLAEVSRVVATGATARREIRSRDGQFFLKRILPFRNVRGEIDGVVITFADITAVRHMQDRFDLAIEASRLVWWDWDITHDHLSTHSAGWCILGYDLDVINRSGAGWLELVHPEDRIRVKTSLDAALRGDTPVWDCEHRFQSRSGSWLWVANKGRVTERDPHGKPLRMLGTTQDIDARKNAEVAVARDLELLAHVPDAVICVDTTGLITYWNQAATDLYGWQPIEILGRSVTDRFPAEAKTRITATFEDSFRGRDFSGEFEDYRKDGSRVWVEARTHRLLDEEGRVFGIMAISRDITEPRRQREERARIEHQLAQSQKMETLGNLAGGIAHDFNNLLAAILGYAEIATGLLPENHPALAKLANVRNAGQRAAELVRRILAFSRAGEQPRRPVRVAQVVEETLPLLRASLPSTIQIRSRVAPDADHTVLGDHTQLQQVLLNLCTNSAHAIGERNGGRLDITLEPVQIDNPPDLHVGAIPRGLALLLSVSDNGSGIPREILERVFEPFFTTKPIGEGTGLGLSIVHSIVAAHGGGILIESEAGVGTSFRIYLPAFAPTLEDNAPLNLPSIPSAFACGNGERVAVIDDEESVALLTQQALERYGYSAEIMPDAPTCLDLLRANPDAFSLVVTDQTMPLMTGLELVQALRLASIQTPVILLSGYSRALDPDLLPGLGRIGFLAKPFVLSDLLEHVHAIVRPPAS